MASARVGTHGGKRDNSGRKRKYPGSENFSSQNKRVYLSLSIFLAWREAKNEAGYQRCSDSDFASHLLSLEYRRRADVNQSRQGKQMAAPKRDQLQVHAFGSEARSEVDDLPQTSGIIRDWKASTPLKDLGTIMPSCNVSPIVEGQQMAMSICMEADTSLHESLSSEPLDSSKRLNTSMFTDDELTTDDSDDDQDVSFHDLTKSVIEELNADENMERDNNSNSTYSDVESTRDSDSTESADEGADIYEMPDDETCSDDETCFDDNVDVSSTLQQVQATSTSLIPFGPHRKLSRGDDMYAIREEYKMAQDRKFVCTLGLFLEVFKTRCQTPGCTALPTVKYHFVSMALFVTSTCTSGHKNKFCSSGEVNNVFVNNLQTAASILLSGSHYAKMKRLANFLNMEFLSKSSYYRFQRLYLIPEINEWWCWMRRELISEFSGQDVVVGGDGQCDSPGFNAKNLCYFMVEVNSSYILDIEILDKRHVGLISTNMEKEAVKRSLARLQDDMKVVELVTDASTSIKAFLANEYPDIIHSLDVWHKSKSIKKCLDKLGKPKAMHKVKEWAAHIIRHFWHCSSACRHDEETTDEEALKVMKDKWIGLLHHICNEHQWLEGQCDHEEDEHDEKLPWFDRRDKDYQELQKIILNPELLASFKYYTRFRHTGCIECANSLGLVYTPKRTPFRYSAYKARRQLTAIDWNFHINLPQAKTKSGGDIVTRKYNPRTRQWDCKAVKVQKGYDYIPVMISKILKRRVDDDDVGGVTRAIDLNTSDPALISPTIAHIPPPPTKEIVGRKSRFIIE